MLLPIMNTLANLSFIQLKHALAIREQIETLQRELNEISGGEEPVTQAPWPRTDAEPGSPAARARMAAAQRARWANQRGGIVGEPAPKKRKRRVSAAARAALSAAAKARWKQAKAAGKTTL